jgi:hypothetical protein
LDTSLKQPTTFQLSSRAQIELEPNARRKREIRPTVNLVIILITFVTLIKILCNVYYRQDYLREQSDNIKSVNLVTETVNVLSTLYSNINCDTIEIITQMFDTLNEMTSGNQATRSEIINCKIIDFVNVILRTGDYPECEKEQVSKQWLHIRLVIHI